MTIIRGNNTNPAMFTQAGITQGLQANNLIAKVHLPTDKPVANPTDAVVLTPAGAEAQKLQKIKDILIRDGKINDSNPFNYTSVDEFKNSVLYNSLLGTPTKQEIDNIISGTTTPTIGGGGTQPTTGGPTSPALPDAPKINPMYNEGNTENPEKIQDALSKYFDENGEYKPEGKDTKEKITNTEKDIEEKKAAKEKLGKNYDEYINQEGDNFVRELAAQKREKTIKNSNDEIFKIVQPEEAKKVFEQYNGKDLVKDVRNIDYKVIDYKDKDKYVSKLDADFDKAYTPENIKPLDYNGDLIPEYVAGMNLAVDLQAKGEAKIRALNKDIPGATKEKKAELNTQISDIQTKITETIKKKGALEKALAAKKADRQKKLDEIFAKEADASKNAAIKAAITKRNEALDKINEKDDAEIAAAKTAITSGKSEDVKFDENNVIDKTLLAKSQDRMKSLKEDKAKELGKTDVIIAAAQEKLAELKGDKPPAPTGGSGSSGKSGAFGDTLGNIFALAGMAANLGLFAKQANFATQNVGYPGFGGAAVPPNLPGMAVDWNLVNQISNTSVLPRGFGATGTAAAMNPLGAQMAYGAATNVGATAPIATAQAKMNTGYNLFRRN